MVVEEVSLRAPVGLRRRCTGEGLGCTPQVQADQPYLCFWLPHSIYWEKELPAQTSLRTTSLYWCGQKARKEFDVAGSDHLAS